MPRSDDDDRLCHCGTLYIRPHVRTPPPHPGAARGAALAALIQDSGLSRHIGDLLAVTAATFMPILAALATATGQPVLQLLAPAAMAASCAFMPPVGTAPNAIVYGSGQVQGRDLLRAGLWVNILSWGVIIAVSAVTLRWLA
jgi:hypothetical protein